MQLVPYIYGKMIPPNDGICELCGTPAKRLNDHCHIHGWVRGFICVSCNVLLGKLESGLCKRHNVSDILIIEYCKRCPECPPIQIRTAEPEPAIRIKTVTKIQVTDMRRRLAADLGLDLTLSETISICVRFAADNFSGVIEAARNYPGITGPADQTLDDISEDKTP